MEKLIRFTAADLTKFTSQRSGEIKFGERMHILPTDTDLFKSIKNSDADFVLFGIPEDIGVKANFGRHGAASAWETAIKSIVNLQHNKYCKGSRILILGHIETKELMREAAAIPNNSFDERKKLSEMVEEIDKEVSHIICQIVTAGKIPIIIGGGHNNAYGNIKGTALANTKPINAINFDAHTDFRIQEGRHSGNGFTYAYEEGFLKNYFIFGLHENYASKAVMENIKKQSDRIKFNTYEQIGIRREKNFTAELNHALEFIGDEPFGIELDLDAIANIPSSAMTPSGFSAEEARQFVHFFGSQKKSAYLHICEGAPDLDNEKNNHLTGKLIAYLVTDFIKAKEAE